MEKFKQVKQLGFTLAELLITLGIIGIVASMTIPSMINNFEEAQWNSGAKKAYSDLLNATKMLLIKQDNYIDISTDDFYSRMVTQYCTVMQCVQTGPVNALFHSGGYKFYKSTALYTWLDTIGASCGATFSNGSVIFFEPPAFGVTSVYHSAVTGDHTNSGDFFVDINGQKGPNMWGKDLIKFYLELLPDGSYTIVPFGLWDNISTCAPGGGNTCTNVRLNYPDNMQ